MSDGTIRIDHPLAQGACVDRGELWSFPEGLIGLPDFKSFALLPLKDADPFRILCAADDPSVGIVVVDPAVLVPDYTLALSAADLGPLPSSGPDELEILVPVVLPSGQSPLSLNLKGPILFSRTTRIGIQRISTDESHSVRFVPQAFGTGTPSCSS